MQVCKFAIGFPFHVLQNCFWGLKVKMWKYCVLTPPPKKKGTTLHAYAWRVCWCIACQNRFNSLSVEKFCVSIYKSRKKEKEKKKENWVVTLAIWEEVTSVAILTKCGLWAYGGLNHVCDIWWLSVKGCGCGERGNFDLRYRPYNNDHTTAWPCDGRVT